MKDKIYFAGSISGGRNDVDLYEKIIAELKNYGEVLTEHVGNSNLLGQEQELLETEIHDRDIMWLKQSAFLIAEVTQPSLGVGYELCTAMNEKKEVLCLFNVERRARLSAMIAGQTYFKVAYYKTIEDVKEILKNYFSSLK